MPFSCFFHGGSLSFSPCRAPFGYRNSTSSTQNSQADDAYLQCPPHCHHHAPKRPGHLRTPHCPGASFWPLTPAHHAPHGLFTESFLCGVPAAPKCLLEESAGLAASKSPFVIIYLRALGAPCFNPGIPFHSIPLDVCFPNPQQVPKLGRNNPEEMERGGELGGALSAHR